MRDCVKKWSVLGTLECHVWCVHWVGRCSLSRCCSCPPCPCSQHHWGIQREIYGFLREYYAVNPLLTNVPSTLTPQMLLYFLCHWCWWWHSAWQELVASVSLSNIGAAFFDAAAETNKQIPALIMWSIISARARMMGNRSHMSRHLHSNTFLE